MSSRGQSKWQIIADPAECRGCLTCQLVCSLRFYQTLSPAMSMIRIGKPVKQGAGYMTAVSFTDDCDQCGLCVKYCSYGALSRKKKQET